MFEAFHHIDYNVPVKIWSDNRKLRYEDMTTLKQVNNLAKLPFVFKHIALMPDYHAGYGMPIGGVLATDGVVIPNAVGKDIGCGMCAVRTNLEDIDRNQLQAIVLKIKECIPTGFDWHKDGSVRAECLPSLEMCNVSMPICHREYENAALQLGTLGGGNHFIEVQKGSDGYVWIMIHSGSRNLGKKVADHYDKIAIQLNKRWYSQVSEIQQLAFLPIEEIEAKRYMYEMDYCVRFALANRKEMIETIKGIFINELQSVEFDSIINIAHNYAAWENHFGTNVIVHRKGATRAREGERGIIPGSQGTSSYIVKGLGEKQSFQSCSHGAGRIMGRKEAQKSLNLNDELSFLNEQNIIHSIESKKDLDEAPHAYKDIDEVMDWQKDLVEIEVKLKPMAVVKG